MTLAAGAVPVIDTVTAPLEPTTAEPVPSEVFDEMVALMPSYTNLHHGNLGASGKLYPNDDPEHSDGTIVMFDERFNTDDGLAHLVPAQWLPPKELPDAEYPLRYTTGRTAYHFHTRTKTGRSRPLTQAAPRAWVEVSPDDAARLGIGEGDLVRVTSRRGRIEVPARISDIRSGTIFAPFHYGYWDVGG